ncbi:hypothetical protein PU630_14695 [Microbacterium horticulturae]|uniref:Acyl-CoA dehydrogenase C-terminal domain-containing protein n=1 Tax=Microbacterium horticulturae TaxID=3028316 RepID=A0ABY8BZQ9_9MICO|nr:acyl-CoA dehydrogenase family protein [Microbacterium sp. KACC 23027]WEG08475.1 hypothetical protein PU630_14695 [Microbacterium sp. KACC 23027]
MGAGQTTAHDTEPDVERSPRSPWPSPETDGPLGSGGASAWGGSTLSDLDSKVEPVLAFLREHRKALLGAAAESEELRHPGPRAREILREAGTPHMRLPRSVGGLELSLSEQMRVLRELAEIDAATAWCSMVTNNATAVFARSLPEETFVELFVENEAPIAVGVIASGGQAERVEGGYIVDGTWSFCSAIDLADWVMCNPLVDGDPAQPLGIAVPKHDVRVNSSSWNVVGLRGTGSADFTLDKVFVPDAHLLAAEPRRTWANTTPHSDPDEHIAIAIGIARHALGSLREGYLEGTYKWRDREVVQSEFSRLTIAVDAAERMAFQMFEEVERCETETLPNDFWLQLRALGAYVTELAVECAGFALRRGGGRALYMPNALERTLRDALAAQAHILVSDQNYAAHGAALLGLVSDRPGHR